MDIVFPALCFGVNHITLTCDRMPLSAAVIGNCWL